MKQAEDLGREFWKKMYPNTEEEEGMGLLWLHATYWHDLKIYASPEGRCQKTTAAFTKGLLDLDVGDIVMILPAMVRQD